MSVVLAKIMKPLNVDVLLTRSVMRKVLCLTQLLTWVELQVNLGANVSGFDCDNSDTNGGGGSDGGDGGGDSDGSSGDGHGDDDVGGGGSGGDGQENSPTSAIKEEIVSAILKGLILAEKMKTSVESMENLLEYAKELYCKGDRNLEKY